MQAAMRVALNGGFSAMTVRQIASEAGVAAGQLHHHFASTGELKAQAFIRLIREMLDIQLLTDDASWSERLFSLLAAKMAVSSPISACGGKRRFCPIAMRKLRPHICLP